MQILRDGSAVFQSSLDIPGDGSAPFAIGAAWLVEVIRMTAGELFFVNEKEEIRSASKFAVYYSPFSIVRTSTCNVKAEVFGIGSFEVLPGLPPEPFIFETDRDEPFVSASEAVLFLSSARDARPIESNSSPSLLSLKAKRLIDENYRGPVSISGIASRLKVSHEHLSRQFKRDYRFSPNAYLHRLRTAEASYKLQKGEQIIEVSADVGYNDLSRFYKQFRKGTKVPPGSCRE